MTSKKMAPTRNSKSDGAAPPSKLLKTTGAMAGGVVEACCLQPLDVIKTRLQLGGSHSSLRSVAVGMARQEGFLAFYKGLTPFCTHLVTKYAVRWWFFEFYRELCRSTLGMQDPETGKLSLMGGGLAGFGAGVTEAVLIVTPFEVLKTRLQAQKGVDRAKLKYKGPIDAFRTIVKEEGAVAMWKGNTPTMFRQGWNQFFLFGTYGPMKMLFFGKERDAYIEPMQSVAIGLVAGALGPLTNNPFDVAKTRLMAQKVRHNILIFRDYCNICTLYCTKFHR